MRSTWADSGTRGHLPDGPGKPVHAVCELCFARNCTLKQSDMAAGGTAEEPEAPENDENGAGNEARA
ncbi:hypothetical protein PR003_g27374 [Phytophthora rubi]|uniref:Uncharacterized protein n=1 Tax=Phytophthora rubi TaxID=129364 RepID=A0A6A4BYW5_9STRA|nr:hypothetical protein PR002_g30080 [Phytophthora rubi]KAE9282569.1 hypothetical protein PR003_g27374 [Phytophthora rubi]